MSVFHSIEAIYVGLLNRENPRPLISLLDASALNEDQKQWVDEYKRGIYIIAVAVVLLFVIPLHGLMVSLAVGGYGVWKVEKNYKLLAASTDLKSLQTIDSIVAIPKGRRGRDVTPATGKMDAGKMGTGKMGSGPWMAYVMGADGKEVEIPFRFETEEAAAHFIEKEKKKMGSDIMHAGTKYVPE